ncbi:hypothetical protein Agabi119p4_5850 [Agaricus bisporus var. burnettii]|uniref:Uncharacterized protein n=1 Tax=Agaricus bisporus var. burnettii TaxID=192524 RepID=A0A8H7KGY3_AGABI|nr:hypothetical protein Agabi119p4_5850 [Agaricus bisporus var. burnettii]
MLMGDHTRTNKNRTGLDTAKSSPSAPNNILSPQIRIICRPCTLTLSTELPHLIRRFIRDIFTQQTRSIRSP